MYCIYIILTLISYFVFSYTYQRQNSQCQKITSEVKITAYGKHVSLPTHNVGDQSKDNPCRHG